MKDPQFIALMFTICVLTQLTFWLGYKTGVGSENVSKAKDILEFLSFVLVSITSAAGALFLVLLLVLNLKN